MLPHTNRPKNGQRYRAVPDEYHAPSTLAFRADRREACPTLAKHVVTHHTLDKAKTQAKTSTPLEMLLPTERGTVKPVVGLKS